MLRIFAISSLIFFIICEAAYSQGHASHWMLEARHLEVATIDYKTSEELSKNSITIHSESPPEENTFTITQAGHGHIDRYDSVSWVITSRVKEENGNLQPLGNSCEIKDASGKALITYTKSYDYQKRTITWESFDTNGRQIKSAVFPIKGKTCDDKTLIFFLKSFLFNDGEKEQYFYLLTNEPRLFKTRVRYLGTEDLTLPSGKITAMKFKLTADIGIIDDVLDRFVPKTYIWYSKAPPHSWLKYQGFLRDAKSRYVINILLKKTPGKPD